MHSCMSRARIRVAFGAVGLCVDLCFLRYAEGLEVRSLRQCSDLAKIFPTSGMACVGRLRPKQLRFGIWVSFNAKFSST